MILRIIYVILIGGFLLLAGLALSGTNARAVEYLFYWIGWLWWILGLPISIIYSLPFVQNFIKYRKNKNILKQMALLNKLHNEGLLSKEDFDKKLEVLKKKVVH
jgi:uncharacterized membrane protein YbhN (UPF0104 family)